MLKRTPRRAAAVFAVLLAGAAVFAWRGRRAMVDFTVNYTAGDRILHGETLYRLQDEHYQFKYSPYCAMIYLPMALLPLPAAKAVWFAFVLAALTTMVILTRRLIGHSRPPTEVWAAAGVPALVLAKFFVRELELGQINAIITAILLGMTILLVQDEESRNQGKAAAAGFLWGAALVLKPYAAIFLPYFVVKRKWNALWPGLIALALSLLAPAFFYGFPGNIAVHEEWIASLAKSTPGLLASQDNVSLLAFLMKRTGDIAVSRLIYAGLIPALAAAVLAFIRRGRRLKQSLPAEGALLLLLIPLISPLGWDYTFLSAILAAAVVTSGFREFPPVGRILLGANFGVIGLTIYDLMGRKAYAAFMTGSILTVNFLVLAAGLFYLRFTGKA
jgi:alpha-1,2-mannosyltransferase